MNPELPSAQRTFPFTTILIVVLSLATLIFAGLFLVFFSQASNAKSSLDQAKSQAAIDSAEKQKKVDAAASLAALEVPYRSYQAPTAFGSFTVNFPKTWSSKITESAGNPTQVNLSVNPDFIRYRDDVAQPVALRVRLIQQSTNAFIATFSDAIKSGALKKSSLKVSGQDAIALTGHFHDDSGAADFVRLVAVGVRDKVVVFSCENGLYTSQFDSVIAESKIIP